MKLLRLEKLNRMRALAWLTALLFLLNAVVPAYVYAEPQQTSASPQASVAAPATTADEAPQLILRTDLAASYDPASAPAESKTSTAKPAAATSLSGAAKVEGAHFVTTFNGQNVDGPYGIGHTRIAPQSEKVYQAQQVGERTEWKLLQRGADYEIDYRYGVLQFRKPVAIGTTIKVTGWASGPETVKGHTTTVSSAGEGIKLGDSLQLAFNGHKDTKANVANLGLDQKLTLNGLKLETSYYTSQSDEVSYRAAYAAQRAARLKTARASGQEADLKDFKPNFSDAHKGNALMVDNGEVALGNLQAKFFYRSVDSNFTLTDSDPNYVKNFAQNFNVTGTKANQVLGQLRGRTVWGISTGMALKDNLEVAFEQLGTENQAGAKGSASIMKTQAKLGSKGSVSYTVRQVDDQFDFAPTDKNLLARYNKSFGLQSKDVGQALRATRGSKVSILDTKLAPSSNLQLGYKSFSTQYGETSGSASVLTTGLKAGKLNVSLRYRTADAGFGLSGDDVALLNNFKQAFGVGGKNASQVLNQVRDRSSLDLSTNYVVSDKLRLGYYRGKVEHGKQAVGRADATDITQKYEAHFNNGDKLKLDYVTTDWTGHEKTSGVDSAHSNTVLGLASKLPVGKQGFKFNFRREVDTKDNDTRDATKSATTVKQNFALEGQLTNAFKLKTDLATTKFNTGQDAKKALNMEFWGTGKLKGRSEKNKPAPLFAYRTRENLEGVTTRKRMELNGPGFKLGDKLMGNFNLSRQTDNGETETTNKQLGAFYKAGNKLTLNLAYRSSDTKAIGEKAKSANVWASFKSTSMGAQWELSKRTHLNAQFARSENAKHIQRDSTSMGLSHDLGGAFGLKPGSKLSCSFANVSQLGQSQNRQTKVEGTLKLSNNTLVEGQYIHWHHNVTSQQDTKQLKVETVLDILHGAKLSYNYGSNPLVKKNNKQVIANDKQWTTLILTGDLDKSRGLAYSFAIQNGRKQAGANYNKLTQFQLKQKYGKRSMAFTIGQAGWSNSGRGTSSGFYSFSYAEELSGGRQLLVTLTDDPGRFKTKNGTEIWAEYHTSF